MQTLYSSLGANLTGLQYRTQDNDRFASALTQHSGSARPSYAVAGTLWLNTSAAPWALSAFDGADDITLGYLNPTTNVFAPAAAVLKVGAYDVALTATAPTALTLPATGTLATLAGTETLTNKTLTTPVLGVATATSINKVALTAPASSATLTLADNSTLATVGAYSVTLTATAATALTLPTTGTVATLAGSETLINKTLTSPTVNGDYAGTRYGIGPGQIRPNWAGLKS